MNELTFGYSDSEDRMWLALGDGSRFWLTRRLLVGFLGPVAALMERTVPGGDLPSALPPEQRIALEHEASLADGPEGQPALIQNKETRKGQAKAPKLLNSISVQLDGMNSNLKLAAGGEEINIKMPRIDFHRTLTAAYRVTVRAHWNIEGVPGWLAASAR